MADTEFKTKNGIIVNGDITANGTLYLTLGSDAAGDIYTRAANGAFTRIAKGANNTLLIVNSTGGYTYATVNSALLANNSVANQHISGTNTIHGSVIVDNSIGADQLVAADIVGIVTDEPAITSNAIYDDQINPNHINTAAKFESTQYAQLRVNTASAVVPVFTSADELVLENDANAGMSILTPNTETGAIAFGDPQDNNVGQIKYDHLADEMRFHAGGAQKIAVNSTAMEVNGSIAMTLGSDATGDIYVRSSSGTLERVAKGANNTIFGVNSTAGFGYSPLDSNLIGNDQINPNHINTAAKFESTQYAQLRVNTASAVATAGVNEDELVVENNANAGISILTPNTATGKVTFGDSASGTRASVAYEHSSDRFKLTAAGAEKLTLNSTVMAVNGTIAMTLGSDATGDIYVRSSSGTLERVAKGANGTYFGVNATSGYQFSTFTIGADYINPSMINTAATFENTTFQVVTADELIISNAIPTIIFDEPGNLKNIIYQNAETFFIGTQNSTGGFVGIDYRIYKNAFGGTEHNIRTGGVTRLTVNSTHTLANGILSVTGAGAFSSNLEANGTMRIIKASSGGTATNDADEIIIENNANAGISILTPNTGTGMIAFGDSQSGEAGYIKYLHDGDANRLSIGRWNVDRFIIDSTITLNASANVNGILNVTGNAHIQDSYLRVGLDDSVPGNLFLYGGGTGEVGGQIRIYNDADQDATIDYWAVESDVDGSLSIGVNGRTDFRISTSGHSYLGQNSGLALIGVTDIIRGQLYIEGGSASTGGGTIRLYNDADNDATVDYYNILATGGNLQIGRDGSPDITLDTSGIIRFNSYGAGVLQTDANGSVTAGSANTTRSLIGLNTDNDVEFRRITIGASTVSTTTDLMLSVNAVIASGTSLKIGSQDHVALYTGATDHTTGTSGLGSERLNIGSTGVLRLNAYGAGVLQTNSTGYVIANSDIGGGYTAHSSNPLTLTSNTVTFSSIPSGTQEILIFIDGASSTLDTRDLAFRLGDAGGIETAGYYTDDVVTTSEFLVGNIGGISSADAIIKLNSQAGTNKWWADVKALGTSEVQKTFHGNKALSATLTQIQIYKSSTGTFDAGTAYLFYR